MYTVMGKFELQFSAAVAKVMIEEIVKVVRVIFLGTMNLIQSENDNDDERC